MVQSKKWILNDKPENDVDVKNGGTFKLVDFDTPELQEGELLVKTLYLSNDPAQRAWITKGLDPKRSYTTPVEVGDAMRARGLAEVIESKSSKHKKGDYVLGMTNWQQLAVLNEKDVQPATELPNGLSRTHYLGALGLTGLTAYYGIKEIVRVTEGDIVIVSGAAGATGSMVVQIAKKMLNAKKVIGIAGSDDKCRWVEGLGADVCINYKKSGWQDQLAKETPDFAQVYFDNVGGEMLDFALTRLAKYGRVAACGAISNYNLSRDKSVGLKNWFEVISMRLEIRGFIVIDYLHKIPEVMGIFRQALQDGKLVVDEKSEHVVNGSFEDIPKTWTGLFSGQNVGKLVTGIQ